VVSFRVAQGKGVTDYGEGADPFGSLVMPVLHFLKKGGMVYHFSLFVPVQRHGGHLLCS